MCLKDVDDNLICEFELREGLDTLTCLRTFVDDLKLKVDRAHYQKV